jgi:hypothetical protein
MSCDCVVRKKFGKKSGVRYHGHIVSSVNVIVDSYGMLMMVMYRVQNVLLGAQ